MKIRVEIDPSIEENEVIIKCPSIDESVTKLQSVLLNTGDKNGKLVFYKDDTEFYLSLDSILFFETSENTVVAHTANDYFEVHYKLYELESSLPLNFIRVSKSAILNVKEVYCITRNLTAASKVDFANTHKSVFVSRNYYKLLKDRMAQIVCR